jgi:hypothetical protein
MPNGYGPYEDQSFIPPVRILTNEEEPGSDHMHMWDDAGICVFCHKAHEAVDA